MAENGRMARFFMLSLALGTASMACTTAPGPRPASQGTAPLVIPYLEERALLLLLDDRRTYDGFTVAQALEADAAVRRTLALTLGRIGDPRGRPVLQELLGDSSVGVRRAAVFGLGLLAVPGDGRTAAILLRSTIDPDRETGRLAVEALGKLGVAIEEVVAQLITLPTEELFARLLPSLFRFSGVPVVRWAEQGVELDDPALRAMAAYGAAREPQPAGAALLRQLLDDADPWVRGWAARGLGAVGGREDLDRLQPLLSDPYPGPIIQALRAARRLIAAGEAAAPQAWKPTLQQLLADPRPAVRLTAVEAAAAWLRDEEIGADLERALASPLGRERALALVALAEGGDPRAPVLVSRFARDADPMLRAQAALAAGFVGAHEMLAELANDADPGVRTTVLTTRLAAAQGEAARALASAGLADPDPAVRAVALGWAEAHPVLPMEELQEVSEASRRDRIPDARLTAVRAFVARARAEPLERGAIVALLEEMAADDDYRLRRAAADGLVELDRPRPEIGAIETGRTVDVYRQLVARSAVDRVVDLITERGTLRLRLACPEAPLTCINFLQLANQGFYDGLVFHRVVPDFVVQGGDPRGDGNGGPGYAIRDEINLLRYERGTVGMALAGPDTGGSQFFITLSPQPHLDGGYTVFGRVIGSAAPGQPVTTFGATTGAGDGARGETVYGDDPVLDAIVQGDHIERIVEVVAP